MAPRFSRLTLSLALAALITIPVRLNAVITTDNPVQAAVSAQTAVPPNAPVTPPTSVQGAAEARELEVDYRTEIDLLNRIQTLLDRTVGDKNHAKREIVGTSGSSGASLKVVVDRAELDEIRAEIAQIKLMLQGKQSVALRPR